MLPPLPVPKTDRYTVGKSVKQIVMAILDVTYTKAHNLTKKMVLGYLLKRNDAIKRCF
jgi:hypothetical protein